MSIILCTCVALATYSDGMRGTSWGLTRKEVRLAEKSMGTIPLGDTHNVFFYAGVEFGISVVVSYRFNKENKLEAIAYYSREHTSTAADEMLVFYRLYRFISAVYGSSVKESSIFTKKSPWTHSKPPPDIPFAIQQGYLSFNVDWETPETSVQLVASGSNNKVHIVVVLIPRAQHVKR